MDLVTVVIPCYNTESLVGEAIESALAQTYRSIEVVVVDDGSTDGSLDVIKRFDDHIRWTSIPNAGGCAARNKGIEMADGRWIQFLDADDLLAPETVSRKIAQSTNPAIVVCTLVEPDPALGITRQQSRWGNDDHSLEAIFRGNSPQTSAPLHLAENLRKVDGFRVGLPCAQEFDLHIRLATQLGLRFECIDVVGTQLRSIPNSVSRRADSPFDYARGLSLYEVGNNATLLTKLTETQREALSQSLALYARGTYRSGRQKTAHEYMRTAKQVSNNWMMAAYPHAGQQLIVKALGFGAYEKLNSFRHKLRAPSGR